MMNNNRGFTIIELLVAMAISVVVTTFAITSYTGQQESQLSQKQVTQMQENIRAGLYIMAMEIRMAGYDPYSIYNAGISNAGNGSVGNPLTFTLVADDNGEDNNNDGTVDEQGEFKTISFQLYDAYADVDNDIGRAVGGGNNQSIAENIQNLQFTYRDKDGIVTADTGKIKTVQIDITAEVDQNTIDYTLPNTTRSLSTIIYCRNLNL